MKIASVTPYDFARPGGVNSYVLTLAQWLRTEGHDVHVLGPSSADGDAPDGVTVMGGTRSIAVGGTVAAISLSHRLGGATRDLLTREDFDLVHLHEPLMPLLPLQILRASEALNVGTFHSAERVARRFYRLAAPALRRLTHRLHARTAVSPVARRVADAVLNGPCEIIPCCTNVEHFRRPQDAPPELADGRRNILFVGRVEPRKGLGVLLDAYRAVRRAHPDIRLVIVGPLDRRARRLQARVRRDGWDEVLFTGAVSPEQLPGYYQSATVFCTPALAGEAFGLVLVEAMAAGAPVVASNIPGYHHVIGDSGAGLLVPPNRPADLAAALSEILEDDARQRTLRSHGRQRAQEFSVEMVGPQVVDLYDRLLNGQRSPRDV